MNLTTGGDAAEVVSKQTTLGPARCRLPNCASFVDASTSYGRGIAIEMSAVFCHLNVES